ncbi:hypothetical protein J2Z21_004640 [Streptomyces griseochromogenes]|uniref:Uncharacterized protein n=1 Tax=Streptomyces griseochromogenes TaxID=68214 RepID=A0A1B1ATF6_9ACTN|nr:hypothetical protein [Streptomyces griseochromogenes]ANP49844.1 hypothetical protein AVL59_09665 [Streptomyces griseochromogenes]MBP2051663.1 hypothetical protein [Streptomyces griseochromogenes]
MFAPVTSDPTASHLIDARAGFGDKALSVIRTARFEVHCHAWMLAVMDALHAHREATVDLDGVLVIARSDKAPESWDSPAVSVLCGSSAKIRTMLPGWA